MTNFILLLLLLLSLLLFLFSLFVNKNDYLTPSVSVFAIFTISILFAFIGNSNWKNNISITFFIYCMCAFFSIISSGYLAKKIVKKKSFKKIIYEERYDIERWKVFTLVSICILLTVLYAKDILLHANQIGVQGLEGIGAVKKSDKISSNFILRQGIKIITAVGYVFGWIFVKNMSTNARKISDIFYLIPILCIMICSFFTGVRTEMIRPLFALFVYYLVIQYEKREWKTKNISIKKILKKIIIPISVFLFIFYIIRTVIKSGKVTENQYYGFIEYLSYYVGSSWIVLNNKISLGLEYFKGTIFGELTFSGLWSDLIDANIMKSGSLTDTKFVTIDVTHGVNGNADTIFGNSLVDFGLFGMCIFIFVVFFVISYYYYKFIFGTQPSYKRNLKVINYAFIFYIVGLSFYANIISYFVSLYFLLTWLLIWIIYYFCFKVKIELR